MFIIIIGGGKVGSNSTKLLREEGHKVCLIEKDKVKTRALSIEFGEAVIHGNGSCIRVLREGGVEGADVLVAVTGADEDNLVICQVAKAVFKCPRTIALVNDPRNESLFCSLGIDLTISSAQRIASWIKEKAKTEK